MSNKENNDNYTELLQEIATTSHKKIESSAMALTEGGKIKKPPRGPKPPITNRSR